MHIDILRKQGRRGQISFEFTLSFVMGMIIVVALLALFANKLGEVRSASHDEQVTTILDMLADEIDLAKGSPQGYTRTFTLPITVEGVNFSLNATGTSVLKTTLAISYQGKDFTRGFSYPINMSLCLESLNTTTRSFEVRRTSNEVILDNCPDCQIDYEECFYYDSRSSCSSLGVYETECQERYCLCT